MQKGRGSRCFCDREFILPPGHFDSRPSYVWEKAQSWHMPRSLCNVLVLHDKSSSYDGICPVSYFLVQTTISRGKAKDTPGTYYVTGTGASEVKVMLLGGAYRDWELGVGTKELLSTNCGKYVNGSKQVALEEHLSAPFSRQRAICLTLDKYLF